jgi:heme/copper-type cytochrome/quinol oxidase subunit 2
MYYLAATVHTLGVQARETARRNLRRHPEGGSVTIEQVIWAVAVIAIVGIVVVAITNYVTTKAGQIK